MADLKLMLRLDALDRATKPLRNLQGAINDTSRSAAAQRKRLLELQRTINNAPANRAQFEQMQRTRREIDQVTQSLARQERQIRQWARTRDARASGKQMMMNGSMQLAGAGAVAYGVNSFMQDGEQFDVTMSRVQALARLDKDSETLKALREQAKKLGATTWADPTQVAEGQAFYAMAGFTPDKIMNAMSSTLDLARASGLEIGQSADIGSNILSAFGLDAGEMSRVSDVLVGTFTRTNTTMEGLGNTMKYVAPVAKGLGVSLEETAAIAGVLGNVGIQDTQAGTAMRAILSRLAAGPKMATKALNKIGIKTSDKNGDLKQPIEILMEVMERTKKMGNTQRMSVLKDIAGLEAASAMMALVEKGNVDDLKRVYAEILENKGESNKIAKVMADNLSGDKQQFNSAVTDWKIAIQEVNDSGLRDLVQNMTKVMQAIGDWTKANPELISSLSKITGGAIALTAAIGGITIAAGFLKFAFVGHPIITVLTLAVFLGMQLYNNFDAIMELWNSSPTFRWIASLTAIGTGLALIVAFAMKFKVLLASAAFAKVSTLFMTMANGMKALNFAFLASPIFWALALMAGLIYMVYKNWDSLVWFWNEGAAQMQKDWGNLLAKIPSIGPALQLVWDIMSNGFSGILSIFQGIYDLFFDTENLMNKLGPHIDDLSMHVQRFWNDFKEVGAPVIDWFSSAIEVIMNGLNGIVNIYDSIVGKTSTEMYDRLDIYNRTGLTASEFNNLPELAQLQAMGVNQPFQPIDIPVPSGPRLPGPPMTTQSNQTMNQTNTIIVNGSGDPKSTADSVMDALKQSTDGSAKLWDAN